MPKHKPKFQLTPYGFEWGAAIVTRIAASHTYGWVLLEVKTPKQTIQISVSRTGKVRVVDNDGEWFSAAKKGNS